MVNAITIQDIFDWNRHYKNHKASPGKYYLAGEENKMFAGFHYLLNYYFYRENCVAALQNLQDIFNVENFLAGDAIKEWATTYEYLGSKKLVCFLTDNEPDEKNSSLKMLGLGLHVELKPFMPIVIFCEVFAIIYFELQLHLPENKRVFDEPGHYYYTPPSLVPPEVRIKEWFAKL